jgi:hypothetical protein
MLSKNINDFDRQASVSIDRETLKLKLAIIGVLAANAFLTVLMPQGIISDATAAESEYQSEVQLVRRVTTHQEVDSTWSKLSEAELSIQENQFSPLEANQD